MCTVIWDFPPSPPFHLNCLPGNVICTIIDYIHAFLQVLLVSCLASPTPSQDYSILITAPALFVLLALPTLPGAVWAPQWCWKETPGGPDNSYRVPHATLCIMGFLPADQGAWMGKWQGLMHMLAQPHTNTHRSHYHGNGHLSMILNLLDPPRGTFTPWSITICDTVFMPMVYIKELQLHKYKWAQ